MVLISKNVCNDIQIKSFSENDQTAISSSLENIKEM